MGLLMKIPDHLLTHVESLGHPCPCTEDPVHFLLFDVNLNRVKKPGTCKDRASKSKIKKEKKIERRQTVLRGQKKIPQIMMILREVQKTLLFFHKI
jgi:hypothetical protein